MAIDIASKKIYKDIMKKQTGRKRTVVIFLRVTKEEKDAIRINANENGLGISEYMRFLLLSDDKIKLAL